MPKEPQGHNEINSTGDSRAVVRLLHRHGEARQATYGRCLTNIYYKAVQHYDSSCDSNRRSCDLHLRCA